MLKYFKKDTNRDKLYPSIACYQMPLVEIVDKAATDLNEELLPSWSKFAQDPIKAKGFFTYMLQAIFEGKHSVDSLNMELQTRSLTDEQNVSMMFISAANNEKLIETGKIAEKALPNHKVITLCGSSKIHGFKVTNRNAQRLVSETIELNADKDILILSNQMAARSFSIPQITSLFLAYDNGDNGATIQKMSRTLTPSDENKVGRIFSLSFDPNRDDKFDAMVVEAALNQKKDDEDIVSAVKRVLQSVDIFSCQEDGAIRFDEASFIEAALQRKALSRVMGKVADIDAIPSDVCVALANGNIAVAKSAVVAAATRGKTFQTIVEANKVSSIVNDKNDEKARAKVREMIVTIIENADIIVALGDAKNIKTALNNIQEQNLEYAIQECFGFDLELLNFIFEQNIIKQEWIDMKISAQLF